MTKITCGIARRALELFKCPLALLIFFPFIAFSADPVPTHFSLKNATATKVEIVGEFNNWTPAAMTKGADDTWTMDIPIPPGEYAYKFLINGNDWEFDPARPGRKTIAGIENSSITIGPASAPTAPDTVAAAGPGGATFTYTGTGAKAVYLVGQFNGWNTTATPLTRDASGVWTAQVPLTPGNYQYKFLVDGQWTLDPANPQQADDGTGNKNSVKVVENGPSPAPAASAAASGT